MTPAQPPRVFSIPAGLPFVDVLADHLIGKADGDPLALARMTVLLPNRRSCRALRDAFLRQSGGRPLLLPRLKPLEPDQDRVEELELVAPTGLDLPQPVPPLERHLILARLIGRMGSGRGGLPPSPDQASRLARELGDLLDQAHIEEVAFDHLDRLVPDDYAAHWQITIDFLKIVTTHWPALLNGRVDHQDWIGRVLDAQGRLWRDTPPVDPVVIAGSTGSRPAVARLMAVVATLPAGQVVLPGLDLHLDDQSWAAIDESHPQFTMKRLLDRWGMKRHAIRPLGRTIDPRAARGALLAEALRPAATSDGWRTLSDFPQALADVARLDAATVREEAGAIALMLRQALETDGRTAALVTPDRDLARRVAAELARWDITIDDSAGRPLAATEPGALLRLSARAVADAFPPHGVLALAKHPLAAAGMDAARFRALARRLETDKILRGPRPAPGIDGLAAACADSPDLAGWVAGLRTAMAGFIQAMDQDKVPLADLVRAHCEAVEALAATPDSPGPARLWRGEAGEALAGFAAELLETLDRLGDMVEPVSPRHYPALIEDLLTGQVVRPIWGRHPRLFIWGPMEARLQHADLMILGGLNEGTWPARAESDPWMSRPMRHAFGLAAPERRIGLMAHDFTQACAAPRVVLTRSLRVEGAPTVPSRWLMRLDTVMAARGLGFGQDGRCWLDWHARLDRPTSRAAPVRPAPRPPVAARPRRLSVTEIETWMRDPYAIYARHVLGLRALDPIDADPGAAEYGSMVHQAIEAFLIAFPGPLPADALDQVLAIGEQSFAPAANRPGLWAFWWPRFVRVATWLVEAERRRRPDIAVIRPEIAGTMTVDAPAGPFILRARADRIDVMKDATLALVDYKTGAVPTAKEVAAGFAPQLPLEAAIARAGGFPDIAPAPVSAMLYWRLHGGQGGAEEKSAGGDPERLTDEAIAGLAALVAVFDDPATPYEARPNPEHAPRHSDVSHLARIKEWAAGEDGGEE